MYPSREVVGDVTMAQSIKCVDMHTTGEPTRIVYSGFPNLTGTLLEKRREASEKHDHIRRRLLWEPRGHWDMYGAVLIPETEHVASGNADMGVLFMHNDGFSMMCGHATIALGRFLVDAEEPVFPGRKRLRLNRDNSMVQLNLHVPSGILEITVPILPSGKSDVSRSVSFLSVPSFATGMSVPIPLPEAYRWPELGNRTSVTVDFSYGGAFYCLIDVEELGFPDRLVKPDLGRTSHATKLLKAAINANPSLTEFAKHPDVDQAGYLYSVMIVDAEQKHPTRIADGSFVGEETGLCFFANQQIDRSPTGGCVAARIALAYAKGDLALGQRWLYHSILSKSHAGIGGFAGSVAEVLPRAAKTVSPLGNSPQVRVRVEGQAFYTGMYTVVVEEADVLGKSGFVLNPMEGSRNGG
ncbi:hypothetical protein A1O3_05294 [Capronia epimyces CBS 606.96]|uniref:trans-L-3-hydroxyproline dehydratase n=1 Tax=Capronia epimyces CBS 606.96 TaxID=1182542 RepID=W9YQS5_9EURO|nr:uncharacterized protein A1O3_05294 [Capronia epimyces CBS 606.96]EXJ84624.1 hypothetical protein A1O3_05294 [Capronia epimyces CBS 606.96]